MNGGLSGGRETQISYDGLFSPPPLNFDQLTLSLCIMHACDTAYNIKHTSDDPSDEGESADSGLSDMSVEADRRLSPIDRVDTMATHLPTLDERTRKMVVPLCSSSGVWGSFKLQKIIQSKGYCSSTTSDVRRELQTTSDTS